MIKVGIQARISKALDRTDELGVERQVFLCEAKAEAHPDYVVVDRYVDNDRSAAGDNPNLPERDRLFADLASGRIERILCVSQDRLLRRPDDLEELIRLCKRTGVREIDTVRDGTVNIGSATGKLVARVKVATDANFVDVIREKVVDKKDELARRGLPSGGGRPFGYKDTDPVTGRRAGMEIDSVEAALVHEAATRVLAGESTSAIVLDWRSRGIKPVRATTWSRAALVKMLTSPRIAGLRSHRGEVVGQAAWPAIIDIETHERLCVLLRNPSRATGRRSRVVLVNPLVGVLRCSACGIPLASASRGRKRGSVRLYACKNGLCMKVSITAAAVDEYIRKAVLWRIASPEFGAAVDAMTSPATAGLVAEIAALEHRKAELADAYADGKVTIAGWTRAEAKIDADLDASRVALGATIDNPELIGLVSRADSVAEGWGDMTAEQQRAVIRLVLDWVDVLPTPRKGPVFNPSRLKPHWRFGRNATMPPVLPAGSGR